MQNDSGLSSQSSPDRVQQAIQALRAGNSGAARRLLAEELRTNPRSENAWLVMSAAVDSPEQKRECIDRVLAINPIHPQALQALLEFGPSTSQLSQEERYSEVSTDLEGESWPSLGTDEGTPETGTPPAPAFTMSFEEFSAEPEDNQDLVAGRFDKPLISEYPETGVESADQEEILPFRFDQENTGRVSIFEWEKETDEVETRESEFRSTLDYAQDFEGETQAEPFDSQMNYRSETQDQFPAAYQEEEGVLYPELPATLPGSGGYLRVGLIAFFLLVAVLMFFGGLLWAYLNWGGPGSVLPTNPFPLFGLPGGIALAGLVLGILLAVLLVRTLNKMQNAVDLERESRVITGVVHRRWTENEAASNTPPAYWILYRFSLHPRSGGVETFQARQMVTEIQFNDLTEGSPVQIRYLSRDPQVSRMDLSA